MSVEPQQRGWFARNWLWVIPVGCGLPLLLCCGVGGLVGWKAYQTYQDLRSPEPIKEALRRAEENPKVQAALGTPLKHEGLFNGNYNVSSVNGVDTGAANLTFTAVGPKGRANITVQATKSNGPWVYQSMVVAIQGQPPIDLLASGK